MGAEVRLDGQAATADDSGTALLDAVHGPDVVYVVVAPGFATTGGHITVVPGEASQATVWLHAAATVPLDAQREVYADGVRIDFTDATFAADDTPVAKVDASIVVVDAADEAAAMPEPSRVLDSTGTPLALEPLIALELDLSASGQPVQQTGIARIRLEGLTTSPLLEGLTTSPLGIISGPLLEGFGTSPLGLTLLHFDLDLGAWVPDGSLSLNDGVLEAEVSHFSWWAVAIPVPAPGCAGGTVVDVDGTPVAGAEVLTRHGEMSWSRSWTGRAGRFCTDVPAGRRVTAQVRAGDRYAEGSGVSAQAVCGDKACDVFESLVLTEPPAPRDADGDGARTPGLDVAPGTADCDDTDPLTHPGASEYCDGHDDDCSGVVDDHAEDAPAFFRDDDADGYGLGEAVWSCTMPAGHARVDGDCDDKDPARSPSADEVCNGVDDDCDGETDVGASDAREAWQDLDGDGFGGLGSAPTLACTGSAGLVLSADDCDDQNPSRHPGATETCDGVDQDCDGQPDNGFGAFGLYYLDADEDGVGAAGDSPVMACGGAGYADDSADCDDTDAAVGPYAAEVCDGVDNDCDGIVDVDDQEEIGDPGDWTAEGIYTWPSTCVPGCSLTKDSETRYVQCGIGMDWAEAHFACEDMGMHLAMPKTTTAQATLDRLVYDKTWLGGSDLGAEGVWLWDDGTPMPLPGDSGPELWGGNEPNDNSETENCLELNAQGTWHDHRCDETKLPICAAGLLP